ncbi:MAG TPA: VOC family protein [Rubrobacter sp.]|nr:VOC family protein [Rubrobacter sp.]
MGLRKRYEPGTFCWADLSTPDVEGARAFYGDLLGWEFRDDEIPGGVYVEYDGRGDLVGAIDQWDGYPAHWNNYVSVESVDETAAKAEQLGARMIEKPFDLMEFGRMAVFADPGGAVLCVWEPRDHIGAGRVNDAGCMAWNELQTRRPDEAASFYAGLFGWDLEPIEQDGATVYLTIKNSAGRMNGGIMPMSDAHGDAPSYWLAYFTVPSCDAAVARTKKLGGRVLAGPMEPGFGRISVLSDPQDAPFAVFEGETDE